MHGYIQRSAAEAILRDLDESPAVALLGPRQCGKTTLALEIVRQHPAAVYLDLELPSDLRKLADPELYFGTQRDLGRANLFCLDEIQRLPDLFPTLRSLIDQAGHAGQFLFLGSASPGLLRQTSESLAGRILYLELTPLLVAEVGASSLAELSQRWSRGGFPRSHLATSEASSLRWRESLIQTFLEREIPELGLELPAEQLRRLWRMLAHHHGQLLNSSRLGGSLGLSHNTVRSHIELLRGTFMVRLLEPLETNLKKRLVKSPKVYIRDSGILHALLEIADADALLGHPVCGPSWEGLVIEEIIAALPDWRPSFYRTSNGAEIDLVMSRGQRHLAFECKASTAPRPSRGFWTAFADIDAERGWIVAPVNEPYPLREKVEVTPLVALIEQLKRLVKQV